MSNIFFIADLHLGHSNILKHSQGIRQGNDVEEHDQWLIDSWNSVVTKQDVTYVLGDVAFNKKALLKMSRMNGVKHLVSGNHDNFSMARYLQHFHKVYGLCKKYGFWLSHAPIHPNSLRGLVNVHGHMHQHSIDHPDYFCVSVEQLGGKPIELSELKKRILDKEIINGNSFSK